jgi:Helicase HerA, central domain
MAKLPIPEQALKSHTGILGMTGSGKTTTAKLIVEHVVAEGARVCILDPLKSDWWGLTSSADGKRAGLPFQILGGPHGHVPLHSGAGKAIGELVARGSLPLSIIDMADFEAGGLQAFFVDFAATLMKRMKGVLYLAIEEAHEFAPKERAGIGKENLAIHYAKKIAVAGRTKGIRLLVMTQRTQALHNAILGSCETMVVHRFIAPADQQPVLGWLKGNVKDKDKRDSIESSLSGLADGEAWVVSGVARFLECVQFPRPKTYDNTKTPDEKDGERQVRTAAVDVEKLRGIIGDAVVEAEANDPKKLRAELAARDREIAVLQRKLTDPRGKPVAAAKIDTKALEEEAFRRGMAQGLKERQRDRDADHKDLRQAVHRAVDTAFNENAPIIQPPDLVKASLVNTHPPVQSMRRALVEALARPAVQHVEGSTDLPKGEAKILAALIQFPSGRTRSQLGVLTGYAARSLETYLPRLMGKGYVENALGGLLRATQAGCQALPDSAPLPTGDALQEHWLAILPEGERKILNALIAARGDPVSRDDLQAITQYAARSIETYVPRLAAKGLVVSNRGEIRASEDLF